MYMVDDMVWHKITGSQPNAGEVFLTREIGTSRSSEYFEEIVLMQYTGLKDLNGVEIYEGDIVKEYASTRVSAVLRFEVEWGNHGWNISTGLYEVIGNIHENPELIKKVRNKQ
jgi:uncharacterized phage protein (TIGR01671 family)